VNAVNQTPASQAELSDFYGRIDAVEMAPLWESLHVLVSRQPVNPAVPHIWRYREVTRPFLMEAGALITARQAERRVLILENPALRGKACITQSLYAGLQLVLPGEIAPAHRHTQNALRFIIEGEGAYTTVDGEQTVMGPGDLVITPAWQWHDHGNETREPMVWLDALDIPIVNFLGTSFAQAANVERQTISRSAGDSHMRYGNNLAPVDWKASSLSSPVFSYPYHRTRESLVWMSTNGPADPCHGYKLRYINPATGDHVTPTMAAFMQLLPARFETVSYRSTDGMVFQVVEGEGETLIGDKRFRWDSGDVFVVPGWTSCTHRIVKEAILFSFSDRSMQEKIGLWREERADHVDEG
jgi:gentisate 1,2-dioxygenase